jgi:hypothetical protein
MQFINTIFLLLGILGLGIIIHIITREYYKNYECPVKVIKEPSNNKTEVEGNQNLKKVFGSMFQSPSPWFGSFNIYNENFRSLFDDRKIGDDRPSYITGNI